MTWIIRSASSSDEDSVVRLWGQCGLTTDYNDPFVDFRFACEGAASAVLVALEGERVVGSVMVGHDGHRGWIYYLAAEPERQNRGIGSGLMTAAEDWLRKRRVPKLHLMVRESNAQVTGFYERLGFELMPRIAMAKWLA